MLSSRRWALPPLLLSLGLLSLLTGIAISAFAQAPGAAPSAAPAASSAAAPPSSASAVAPAPMPPTAPPSPSATATTASPPPQVEAPPTAAGPDEPRPTYPATLRPTVVPFAGHVILSADRLFGVSAWSQTASLDSGGFHQEAEASGTMVNLLWSNSSIGSGGGTNLFAMPRLSVDGFVGPNVTIGGSVGFISVSGSANASVMSTGVPPTTGTATGSDFPDSTAILFSPRLGAVVMLGERAAFWLRGGITYFHSTTETKSTIVTTGGRSTTSTTTVTTDGTALTLDPVVVFLPADHVGLTFGPVLDIGLGGSSETTRSPAVTTAGSPALDVKTSNYGAAAGLLVFF